VPHTWLTSDTHFGHENIIRYCGRPYRTLGEMDYDMARRWNERVGVDDLVYHLGDFAMGDPERWPDYRAQLHGRIILVRGNHDRHLERLCLF
jgi:calcineurin-like phosphoesterase family protein